MSWSAQWCGYSACILALPLDIDSVDQCHNLYNTCSDLKLAKSVTKQSVVNMNSEMSYAVGCASAALFSEPAFKTSVIQST